MCLRMYCQFVIYLCPRMQYFKRNILGILAIVVGLVLLSVSVSNITELQSFLELTEPGEYIAVETNVDTIVEPSLMAGGLKVSLIFLAVLFVPVVLSIFHARRKADKKILYLALGLVLINFLVFPYYLTLLFGSLNGH